MQHNIQRFQQGSRKLELLSEVNELFICYLRTLSYFEA